MNKLMRLFVAVMGVGLLMVPALSAPVFALDLVPNDICNDATGVGGENPTACAEDTPGTDRLFGQDGVFALVVTILALVIGVAAVIVIIIAGIQYMLSTGDPTKTNNAKNAILYAIIGIVVAVIARFVVLFIVDRLGK